MAVASGPERSSDPDQRLLQLTSALGLTWLVGSGLERLPSARQWELASGQLEQLASASPEEMPSGQEKQLQVL